MPDTGTGDASAGGATQSFIGMLEPTALAATRAAAAACERWLGREDADGADRAATEAMRDVLGGAQGTGTVIIGEGAKDEAPMLHNGERLGTGSEPNFDVAVDPLEGTKLCSKGLPGALTTVAVAEEGSMWDPGPGLYMDKLVVGPGARDAIDITDSPESNLERIAEALGKPVEDLLVVVLDKPRHEDLIARLRHAGAAVFTPSDGDVAGSLAAVLEDGPADALMGIGGTPEGVMTACAVASLGGGMQGRLAPQSSDETEALASAGMDVDHVLELEELVGGESMFVATGVSGGDLLNRPIRSGGRLVTESIVIAGGHVRRTVESSPEPGGAK